MVFFRLLGIGSVAAVIGLPSLGSAGAFAAAAADKGPPACAKILFRPLPPGQNDGEQEAGIYTSRFSHLELKGTVKSGEAQDYYLTTHNKKLTPLTAIPAAA